jgi:hypothetical protein
MKPAAKDEMPQGYTELWEANGSPALTMKRAFPLIESV